MANKYFDGKVSNINDYDEDKEFINLINNLRLKVDKSMKTYEVGSALSEIFEVLRRSNKYVDETTPWVLYKEGNLDRLRKVLYNLLESVRVCAILLQPFIPDTCEKIFNQLGVSGGNFDKIDEKCDFNVNEQQILFERIV